MNKLRSKDVYKNKCFTKETKLPVIEKLLKKENCEGKDDYLFKIISQLPWITLNVVIDPSTG